MSRDERIESGRRRMDLESITAGHRERRQGHRGLVIWFTGLSGSGKTTLATDLERRLFAAGFNTYRLDGDILRKGLCRDLGFSLADRQENIRRAGEVASVLADAGCIVLCAFISPIRADRDRLRVSLGPGRFVEVYVNTPLAVCEQRDPKGLYAKARSGLIPDFTGVSAPYEAPFRPEIEVQTDRATVEQLGINLFDRIQGQYASPPDPKNSSS